MENNSDFEQQFTQNLKNKPVQPTATSSDSSKLPLVVAIVLAIVTLVESIVLVITLSNYFSLINGEEAEEPEVALDDSYSDTNYSYDKDFNLTAMALTCTSEDGAYYNFSLDNKYEQYTAADSLAASGPYTISNDSLVSLSGSNKVLYYDGFDVADGLTVYSCEEVATEANTNDTEAE